MSNCIDNRWPDRHKQHRWDTKQKVRLLIGKTSSHTVPVAISIRWYSFHNSDPYILDGRDRWMHRRPLIHTVVFHRGNTDWSNRDWWFDRIELLCNLWYNSIDTCFPTWCMCQKDHREMMYTDQSVCHNSDRCTQWYMHRDIRVNSCRCEWSVCKCLERTGNLRRHWSSVHIGDLCRGVGKDRCKRHRCPWTDLDRFHRSDRVNWGIDWSRFRIGDRCSPMDTDTRNYWRDRCTCHYSNTVAVYSHWCWPREYSNGISSSTLVAPSLTSQKKPVKPAGQVQMIEPP